MKTILKTFVLTGILLTLQCSIVFAQDIRVYVDGVQMSFPDQKPIVNPDSRTLVPVRFVSQALGAEVDWQPAANTVAIKHNGKAINLIIGQKNASVGGNIVALDAAASLLGSRAMVPLRFVSECLEAKVEWNGTERAVYISTANSDQALVHSDLMLFPPQAGNPNKIDLQAAILYYYDTPVEPQLTDLKELLEKRFGSKTQEIVDYVAVKKDTETILLDKDWVIDGKKIRVYDATISVSVTIWE